MFDILVQQSLTPIFYLYVNTKRQKKNLPAFYSNMSGKNSFDQLATEILFEIFDYLSYNDIIYTFFYFNQRFNSISLQYLRFLNHFTTPTRHFSFWQTILPIISSKIEYLTITTIDFSFSLDLFPNLKSLIISSSIPIYYDQLIFILKSKQFKKLNLFKIQSEIINKSDVYETPLFNEVFSNENSLHVFESLSELFSFYRSVDNIKISINLQSLSLKIFGFHSLFPLLNYIPNLKYLNFLLLSFSGFNIELNVDIDLSRIKLKEFSFVLQTGTINQRIFSFLTWFIKQFSSSLNYLSLDFNQIKPYEFQFDGFTLQQQLLESMIELKSFHLYMQLEKEPRDIERFLSTFQTQFWFDHHWTFGMHRTYLYTLPFHFDKLKDFIDFDRIKSSNSKIFNSLQTWSHVKSIELSDSFKVRSNIIEQLKLKMPNLTTTTVSSELMYNIYTNEGEINQTVIPLNSITTVHCEGQYVQAIKHWLIHIFPNARHLMLSYSYEPVAPSSDKTGFLQKFEEYFRDKWKTTDSIYLSRIQYVEIKLTLKDMNCIDQHVIRLVKELLEMFINLQSFIFHFYDMPRFPSIVPFTDLNKTIQLLNMEKFAEIYQIKHSHNYLQFIKKETD